MHHEFHDFSSIDHNAAAVTGQTAPMFSAAYLPDGSFAPEWDCGPVGGDTGFSCISPGTVADEVGGAHALAQAPWLYANQAYVAAGDTMSQDAAVARSTGSCFDPSFQWHPPTPMEQIFPSPTQSSYCSPSPASAHSPQYSRHNSYSSFSPATMEAAAEQARFDALQQPVPYQAMNTATATTDSAAGAMSPAMTPSPRDISTAHAHHASSKGTRKRSPTGHQPSPARRAPQQAGEQPAAGSRAQGQQQHQERRPKAQSQGLTGPHKPRPKQSVPRTRNRDSANKCRAKSKLAEEQLKLSEEEMTTRNEKLTAEARQLRDEVLVLKSELLAHGRCDDELIQQYLAIEASKVSSSGSAAPMQQQQHQNRSHGHHF
jgi:hypothetical protein